MTERQLRSEPPTCSKCSQRPGTVEFGGKGPICRPCYDRGLDLTASLESRAPTAEEAASLELGTMEAARQGVYGDAEPNHARTGRMWAALLSEHYQTDLAEIPPHVVAAMMVVFKMGRAVRPFKFLADNYVDAAQYLEFARRFDANGRGQTDAG